MILVYNIFNKAIVLERNKSKNFKIIRSDNMCVASTAKSTKSSNGKCYDESMITLS